ncbi:DNA repair protein RecO [Leptobacterium sp. I13]|uniref:DNA repair protein RecO n=1 Tax=Leptobacterium meishanense TaxID=3128904 RepID=UPI0030EF57D0
MLITTKAIVISALKYGDNSLIVKCYTEIAGIKTYLLKSILSSRKGKIKAAYFQPLTQLEIVANHKNKGTLEYIREVKISCPYHHVHTDIKKNAIALFLSEMLNAVLQEEEKDKALFIYLEEALQWFDANEEIANFHIVFLLNLTKYLGFYPDVSNSEYPYFDLLEGAFTKRLSLNSITGEELKTFNQALGIIFDDINTIKLTKTSRQSLLNVIINYFRLHLQEFNKPRSLSVLHEVFS